jgi:signal transduction histidine kinase
MAEETNIIFAKDDMIIVEEALTSVVAKLAAGGFVKFERAGEIVMVNSAAVRYLRTLRQAQGGR